ncbi:hypothetical protein P3S68_030735 [Capsicum galapagoense]
MRLTTSIIFMIFFMMTTCVNSFMGITWGRQQSQQLVPSMVIDMLLQNKIPALRFMSTASDIIENFSATNISITICLSNNKENSVNRKHLAYAWLNDKVREPINKGVKIVELAIRAEPFSNTFLKPVSNYEVVNVISMMQEILDEMDLRHVITINLYIKH